MRVTVYTAQIDQGDAGDFPAFPSLAAAKKAARDAAQEWGEDVEVTRDVSVDLPPRELAVRLLSGQGWVAQTMPVYVARARGQ